MTASRDEDTDREVEDFNSDQRSSHPGIMAALVARGRRIHIGSRMTISWQGASNLFYAVLFVGRSEAKDYISIYIELYEVG